jgi:hypothetical protein
VLKLPNKLPGKHVSAPGVVTISDQDVGGYDLMVGGHGFRLATDQQFAYVRGSEPTTTRRFDSEAEPGEQSLSALPWIKSQSSFHGGAGQLNLEQGLTSFEYQQEKVDHIRFDNSLGVDVWNLGKVTGFLIPGSSTSASRRPALSPPRSAGSTTRSSAVPAVCIRRHGPAVLTPARSSLAFR